MADEVSGAIVEMPKRWAEVIGFVGLALIALEGVAFQAWWSYQAVVHPAPVIECAVPVPAAHGRR